MSVETIKTDSRHLRGDLAGELGAPTDAFEHDSTVLLKFHGIYQQDDRDVRRERASRKLPLDYSCMVRAAVPGGRITAAQWQSLSRLAALADDSLRLTTRQGVQFHLTPKGSLRELVNGINGADLTTLAACGDVVRNVMACGWPDERQLVLQPLLAAVVARFRPRTGAYWELWIDGDKAVSAEPPAEESEPVYGDAYLPRKFKIAIGWPGDNCVDTLANDVGIVPTLSDGTTGELTGYQIFVGGGLGLSHAREDDTYPRLATPLAWIPAGESHDGVVDVLEAIVTTQRDHGNREDRHRARLKYLVDERGIDWIRAEVEARLDARPDRRVATPLAAPVELPPWTADDHHGHHVLDHDGERFGILGIPVPSGRVADRDGVHLLTALTRLTADGTVPELRVTARQDVLLVGIDPDRLSEVEDRLRVHGVALADDVSALRRLAIACPALPTCGQALGEAERVLPDLVTQLEKVVADTGNGDLAVRLNMTGCPNGCARPYTAEIGIVGRTKKTYDVYVGGAASGDRLGQRIRADVPFDQLAAVLTPVFERYAHSGHGSSFGDWTATAGAEQIATWLPEPVVRRRGASAPAAS
jgi:sulfite reductase (ferredoxin)